MTLRGKTIVITGASRGIGAAIAERCARDGANLVLASKSEDPDPRLPGTLKETAAMVEKAGGKALVFKLDVRFEDQIQAMVAKAVETFGGIDGLINNAGAIVLAPTLEVPVKRFDLMHQVNVRATFLCAHAVLPHLKKSENAHILSLSPPLSFDPKWYKAHLAYTLSKYGMTMCTLGLAAEFKKDKVAVNSLWPKRLIATAATRMLLGEEGMKACRKPSIMAEAAYRILTQPSQLFTGRMVLDEEVLGEAGEKNFDKYAMDPDTEPGLDLFID